MSQSILITGGSGYLGGSLLEILSRTELPPHKALYALVRSQEQADAVTKYRAKPLFLHLEDEDSVCKAIVEARISIIFFLISAFTSNVQITLIKALGQVKQETGEDVHFVHTSGAKVFSEHAGLPTDQPILDTDPKLHELLRISKPPHSILSQAIETNNIVTKDAKSQGVRSYIFIPCIVYGESSGFGNRISIQTTALVKAARKAGAVYNVNPDGASWPVCHVSDNTAVYVQLLESILSGENPNYGKNGYYLASSGSVTWLEIYSAMAKALEKRKVIDSAEVQTADDGALEKMAQALGCPKEMVAVQLGGRCALRADNASKLGWKPKYKPEHILETADAEVELILKHLKD